MKKINLFILLFIFCILPACAQDFKLDSAYKMGQNVQRPLVQNVETKQSSADDYLEGYIQKVQSKVIGNWVPADADKPYVISVRLLIKNDGSLISTKIVDSTGTKEANDAVLDAVVKSMPFEEIKGISNLQSVQVTIGLENRIITKSINKYSSENPAFAFKPSNYNDETGSFDIVNSGDSIKLQPVSSKTPKMKEYIEKLDGKIKKNWHPIQNIPKPVIVVLKIAKDGTLISTEFKEASKAIAANKAILSAIEKSMPFGKLPDDYSGEYAEIEILFHYDIGTQFDYF